MTEIDKRGVVLEKPVDIEWLKGLEPQFFDDFIKFVINKSTGKICIGMMVHKNCQSQMGSDNSCLYGGNLYWDGHVIWESTLNVRHNAKAGLALDEMRVLGDTGAIRGLEEILRGWVRI